MANLRRKLISLGLSLVLTLPSFSLAGTRRSQMGSSCEDILRILGAFVATETESSPTGRPLLGFLMANDEYSPSFVASPKKVGQSELVRLAKQNVRWVFYQLKERSKDLYQFVPRRVIGAARGERGHFYDCVFGDPKYSFTAVHGLQTCIADLPVYGITSIPFVRSAFQLQKKYTASFVLGLLLTMYPTYQLIIKPIELTNQSAVASAEKQQIADHLEFYLQRLKYDPRFASLKLAAQGLILGDAQTQAKGIELILQKALWLELSNSSFLTEFKVREFFGTPSQVQDLIRYPQFQHLKEYVTAPLEPGDLAIYMASWKEIVQRSWMTYLMLEEIENAYDRPSEIRLNYASVPDLQQSLIDILNSDFGQLLRRLESEGRFSRSEVVALLKENLYFRNMFKQAELVSKFQNLKVQLPENFSWEQFEAKLLEEATENKSRWNLPGQESLWTDKGIWK